VLLLYYGSSTGGADLWPLAKQPPPDGIAGYGMSNFPVTYFSSLSAKGNYEWLYDRSAARLRERGTKDFEFFNRDLGEVQRAELWQQALHAPRFKSFEDTFMFYNVAALSRARRGCGTRRSLPAWSRAWIPHAAAEEPRSLLPGRSSRGIRVLDLTARATRCSRPISPARC
jgi:hypothetical protein